MLKVLNPQLDLFTAEVYSNLVPKDHLLVKIADVIDFDFVLERLKTSYSDKGRGSYDPIMMFKLQLLCYLYQLSDGKVIKQAQTDIAFRWFLGLNIYDSLPDDTTVSYFRVHRLDSNTLESLFNEIVTLCIEKNVVKSKRLMIDSTNVEANTNYPSKRTLIAESYHKLMKILARFNDDLAREFLALYAQEIDPLYEHQEVVRTKEHASVTKKIIDRLYLKTYDLLEEQEDYQQAFALCFTLISQGLGEITSDLVISTVDPDARVAHKSPGVHKKGYKDHIIVDEESEIIIASTTTPFNVGDDKELHNLVKKAADILAAHELSIQEISADSVYSTFKNRTFLHDEKIVSNIPFYKKGERHDARYGIDKFVLNEDLTEMTCPAGHTTRDRLEIKSSKTNDTDWRFKFNINTCDKCPLKQECVALRKTGRPVKAKVITIPTCHKIIEADKQYNQKPAFKEANNKRYKVERRFATMVRNHMLRRCRFLRLEGAKKHNILANMTCNIVRLVNIMTSSHYHATATEV